MAQLGSDQTQERRVDRDSRTPADWLIRRLTSLMAAVLADVLAGALLLALCGTPKAFSPCAGPNISMNWPSPDRVVEGGTQGFQSTIGLSIDCIEPGQRICILVGWEDDNDVRYCVSSDPTGPPRPPAQLRPPGGHTRSLRRSGV